MNNDPVIHFYLDEEGEVQKWRRRTALLLALLVEAVFLIVLIYASKYMRRQEHILALEAEANHPKEQTTFLVMPPDLMKELKKAPKTNILSDKNRIARGPSPVVNPHGLTAPYIRGNSHLPKLAGGAPAPRPRQASPPPSPPPQSSPATQSAKKEVAQAKPPPQEKPKPPPPQPQEKQKITLADVQPPPSPNAATTFGMSTPGQAIEQSVRDAAHGRSTGQIMGPGFSRYQLNNQNPNFSTSGPIILSDTRGVDFGPYLAQILEIVRQNWYAVIPESARYGEKGRVAIVFEIMKDGTVPQLRLIGTSGKQPLDRAAEAGIRASIPFPPLPQEFTGNHLVLQFNFFYNMQP